MSNIKNNFIEFTLEHEILKFGNFILNSGRSSPYFFNTGTCNDGVTLNKLSEYYCQLIINSNINFDFIFGPAYKGISLAATISSILQSKYNINKSYCFNRKEEKQHGEKGLFVGHTPRGQSIIIDDVISSGKSIIESIELLQGNNAEVAAIFVAFDRMEIGLNKRASLEIKEKYNIDILSLICLDDVFDYLSSHNKYNKYIDNMTKYINEYKK
tara:strand:+ start:25230 stop:25868 length:639 start_codon:yes stop_codon:yes gene_type:complete